MATSCLRPIQHLCKVCGCMPLISALLHCSCPLQVPADARRSVLVDLLTVYGEGGKAIVFTQVGGKRLLFVWGLRWAGAVGQGRQGQRVHSGGCTGAAQWAQAIAAVLRLLVGGWRAKGWVVKAAAAWRARHAATTSLRTLLTRPSSHPSATHHCRPSARPMRLPPRWAATCPAALCTAT